MLLFGINILIFSSVTGQISFSGDSCNVDLESNRFKLTSKPTSSSVEMPLRFFRHLKVNIWLEARLQLNIGFTLRPVLMMSTRSGITLPKVNRSG